jgi:hypothetical protein
MLNSCIGTEPSQGNLPSLIRSVCKATRQTAHLRDSSLLMRVSSSAEWLMILTATRVPFHTPAGTHGTKQPL